MQSLKTGRALDDPRTLSSLPVIAPMIRYSFFKVHLLSLCEKPLHKINTRIFDFFLFFTYKKIFSIYCALLIDKHNIWCYYDGVIYLCAPFLIRNAVYYCSGFA